MIVRCGLLNIALALLFQGAATQSLAKTGLNKPAEAIEPRDPTQPPGRRNPLKRTGTSGVANDEPSLVLNSILSGDTRRIAVIDGQLVREGERVAGMMLVQVTANSVHLQHPSRQGHTVLRLPKANIAKEYR